jgi:DNA ligase-1
MKFLNEGEKHYVQGSGKNPYEIKKVGGVVSCSCPAWRNLGGSIDNRVCKHIKANIDPACLLPQAQTQAVASGNRFPATASVADLTIAQPKAVEAPPLLLAHSLEDEDPTGYWMSEKLDGVRAYWDGEKFISRLGNEFFAHKEFLSGMPKRVKLDGELFMGRKRFQETVSAVRKQVPDWGEWSKLEFRCFDILEGANNIGSKPFEERMEYLKKLDASYDYEGLYCPWSLVEQTKCLGRNHLKQELARVEALGGEGLMLRKAGSLYIAGRNDTLLKVKTFYDAEAKVVGHKPGKGKHKGRLGALMCIAANGEEFDVGTGFSDKQRENPPKIGSKITYAYTELTKDNKPRFPVFISARDYE